MIVRTVDQSVEPNAMKYRACPPIHKLESAAHKCVRIFRAQSTAAKTFYLRPGRYTAPFYFLNPTSGCLCLRRRRAGDRGGTKKKQKCFLGVIKSVRYRFKRSVAASVPTRIYYTEYNGAYIVCRYNVRVCTQKYL